MAHFQRLGIEQVKLFDSKTLKSSYLIYRHRAMGEARASNRPAAPEVED